MSWCCLVSHQAMSVLQGGSLDYARDDNGAKRYQNSAALLIFMRRTAIPHSSFLIFLNTKHHTAAFNHIRSKNYV